MAAKTARNQRGRPFVKGQSGCPAGKPKGARHRTTLAAEALLDGDAEVLTRKPIGLAFAGDRRALPMFLARIFPPRRERPVRLILPPLAGTGDAVAAMAAITAAVAAGEINLGEATELSRLVQGYVVALAASEFDQR